MKAKLSRRANAALMVLFLCGTLFVAAGTGAEEASAQERQAQMAQNQFLYEDVYFKADSTELLPSSKGLLDRKVDWLKAHPDPLVVIEGHCDARGSSAFNMRLGDARAGKIKTYLVQKGIQASRLLVISYGEEDPVDSGQGEEAWSKNRRVRFVIPEAF